MNIGAISSANISWMNKSSDVTPSFSTTHPSGAPSVDMLDNLMSLEQNEIQIQKELETLDPSVAEDQLRGQVLRHESLAGVTVAKKFAGTLQTSFENLVLK